jgi:hypothetical protein
MLVGAYKKPGRSVGYLCFILIVTQGHHVGLNNKRELCGCLHGSIMQGTNRPSANMMLKLAGQSTGAHSDMAETWTSINDRRYRVLRLHSCALEVLPSNMIFSGHAAYGDAHVHHLNQTPGPMIW